MKSGLPFSIYIVKSQWKKGVHLSLGMRHKSDKYGIWNVGSTSERTRLCRIILPKLVVTMKISIIGYTCRATGFEEDPKVTQDIRCLRWGGGWL